jgi:oligopeptide transport system substrate-binding protein
MHWRVLGLKLSLLLLSAALLPGCSPSNGPSGGALKPGVLRLAFRGDIRTLDPAIASDSTNIAVVRLIYRSLLDFDEDVNLVPMLAEKLPELGPDKRTWTIRLKKGVCFSNGREVVADDFVYSIRRVLDPKTKSSQAAFLGNIAGATDFTEGKNANVSGLRATGRYSLEIETKTPDLTLPYLLALVCTAAVPREEVEKKALEGEGNNFFRQPVGTGPFVLDEWRRDLRLRLKRSEHYSLPDKPALDTIEFTFGTDNLTRQLMFERGELDVLEYPNGSTFVALKNDPRWQPYLLTRVMINTWWLVLNCEMEPFKDRRVRRAFNHAIDKQRILKIINGRGTIAKGVLPPGLPGFNPDLQAYEYDPDKAKGLLAEAGYPDGITKPVPLYVSNGREDNVKIVQAIAQDLARVGVAIDLQQMAGQVYNGAVAKRGQAASCFDGMTQDFPDPWDFLEINFHGKNIQEQESMNYFFFNDAQTNRLLDDAAQETDPKLRLDLYRRAEARIMHEAPLVPLYDEIHVRPHQPWVHGDAIHPVWVIRYEKLSVVP